MPQFVKVAKVGDIPPGTGRELEADGRIIAVFNVDGCFHAIDGTCPHQGGPLGEGALVGAVVTCPWHGWQFDVTSGRFVASPRIVQQVFTIKVEGDAVLVAVE